MQFKKFTGFLLALTAGLFTLFLTSFKNDDGWKKLGHRKVNYGIDHDVLNLTVRDGAFAKLRFEVKQGSLNMLKCTVVFQNGEKQQVELKHNFMKGSESRDIDLDGNKRLIDKIAFWYDTKLSSDKRAVLVVYGK